MNAPLRPVAAETPPASGGVGAALATVSATIHSIELENATPIAAAKARGHINVVKILQEAAGKERERIAGDQDDY